MPTIPDAQLKNWLSKWVNDKAEEGHRQNDPGRFIQAFVL